MEPPSKRQRCALDWPTFSRCFQHSSRLAYDATFFASLREFDFSAFALELLAWLRRFAAAQRAERVSVGSLGAWALVLPHLERERALCALHCTCTRLAAASLPAALRPWRPRLELVFRVCDRRWHSLDAGVAALLAADPLCRQHVPLCARFARR